MAKKSKSSQSEESPETAEDQPIEDANAVDNSPVEEAEFSDIDAQETALEPEISADENPDETPVEADAESVFDMTAPESDPAPDPTPAQDHHVDSASNSVLLPAILGGLIAAGIGFGVAYTFIPRADPGLNAAVAQNTATLDSLREEIAAIPAPSEPVDVSPITADIAALQAQVTGEIDVLLERISDFDERILTLEKQPSGDGTLQESALEAYQAELDDLRQQLEVQAGAAIAQLESTRVEAVALQESALRAAEVSQIRTAIAQIQTAMTSGAPMQSALTDLQDAMDDPIPEALMAVADGAPTLAKLQADFPNAARAALSAARDGDASGEETSGFGSFLREQLNVRSVAPREGDDADAVLSRAQAAVSEGQLQMALDEIAQLPDVAQAQLADWVAVAQSRISAVAVVDEISLSLNVN